jgi:hypothetical protein
MRILSNLKRNGAYLIMKMDKLEKKMSTLEFRMFYHFWNFTNLHQILNIDETLQVMKFNFQKLKIQMIVPLMNFQIHMIIFWSNVHPFRWLLRLWMHLPMLFYIKKRFFERTFSKFMINIQYLNLKSFYKIRICKALHKNARHSNFNWST